MEDKVALSYSIFNTSFGLCGIVLSENGVVKFILPGMKRDELIFAIRYQPSAVEILEILKILLNDILMEKGLISTSL